MGQDITVGPGVQQVTWETLESYVREQVQGLIQTVLEAEVTELLGRAKSERRAESAGGAAERLSGVDGKLVGVAAGPESTGSAGTASGDR